MTRRIPWVGGVVSSSLVSQLADANEEFTQIRGDESGALHHETTECSFVLRPSGDRGVGVFVTHRIAKGTPLRLLPNWPRRRLFSPAWVMRFPILRHLAPQPGRFVSNRELARKPLLAQFARFYGVVTPAGIWMPLDLGRLEVAWFVNHSDSPNAHLDDRMQYLALRDIERGEEITVSYRG